MIKTFQQFIKLFYDQFFQIFFLLWVFLILLMIIFNVKCLNILKYHHFSIVCHDFNLIKYFFIFFMNVFSSIKPIIHIFKNWNDVNQNFSSFCLQCTTYDMKIFKYFFFFSWKNLIREIVLFCDLQSFDHITLIINHHNIFYHIFIFVFIQIL